MTVRLAAAVLDQVVHLDWRMPAAVADTAGGPVWNKLFPLGETYSRKDFGEVTFTREWLQTMLSNWEAAGKPTLNADYWHFGDSDPDIQQPFENKLSSGEIKSVQLRDDGLYGLFDWTDKARGCILKRELRCVSPSFNFNGTNRHTGEKQGPTLLGAALLNDPFLQELPKVAASARIPTKEKTNMDHATACTIHGLNADTTSPEQLKAHMAKCAAAYATHGDSPVAAAPAAEVAKASAAAEEKVKLAREEATKLANDNKRLETEKTELAGRVAKIETERFDEKVTALNKKLLDEGRIVAAQQEGVTKFAKSFGVDEAAKHYGMAEAKVNLKEKGVSGATPEERASKTAESAKTEFSKLMDEYQEKDKLPAPKALAKLKREHPEVFKLSRTMPGQDFDPAKQN